MKLQRRKNESYLPSLREKNYNDDNNIITRKNQQSNSKKKWNPVRKIVRENQIQKSGKL